MMIRNRLLAYKICLVFCFALTQFGSGGVDWAQAESWTDLNGTRTIEAKMVGAWADSIVLQMPDGRRVTVRLENLQAASRIQARGLASGLKTARSTFIKELQDQAAAAAAAAPDPLPAVPATTAYVPLPEGVDAAVQSQWLTDQMARGHLIALLDVLPASYQSDVEMLVKAAIQKVNVGQWQSTVGTLHQVGDLVVTRQTWFFAHPRFKVMPVDSRERFQELVLLVCGALRDTLDPAAVEYAKLESTPLRQWLLERDQALAPYVNEWNALTSTGVPTYEFDKEEKGVAYVKVTMDGGGFDAAFTKVDGRWVAEAMAKTWAEDIAAAKEEIEGIPAGTLLQSGIASAPMISQLLNPGLQGTLAPTIRRMKEAQSQREFLAAISSLFDDQIQPLVSMVATMSGSTNRRGSGSFGSGYSEDDLEMEMEMEMEEKAAMEAKMRAQQQGVR